MMGFLALMFGGAACLVSPGDEQCSVCPCDGSVRIELQVESIARQAGESAVLLAVGPNTGCSDALQDYHELVIDESSGTFSITALAESKSYESAATWDGSQNLWRTEGMTVQLLAIDWDTLHLDFDGAVDFTLRCKAVDDTVSCEYFPRR